MLTTCSGAGGSPCPCPALGGPCLLPHGYLPGATLLSAPGGLWGPLGAGELVGAWAHCPGALEMLPPQAPASAQHSGGGGGVAPSGPGQGSWRLCSPPGHLGLAPSAPRAPDQRGQRPSPAGSTGQPDEELEGPHRQLKHTGVQAAGQGLATCQVGLPGLSRCLGPLVAAGGLARLCCWSSCWGLPGGGAATCRQGQGCGAGEAQQGGDGP